MASDVELSISAETTGFRRAMQEVMQSSKDGAKGIESAFSPLQNVFAGVQGKIAALGAVLAGGAMFRAGIEETKKLTGEANALARQMGITATQASIMNVALGDAYTNAEDYGSASQMLTRQIRTNEEAVNAMGLKTRDASGHYRNMQEVMRDAGKVLEGYKEGIDRTAAAQTLFGRGAGDGAAIIRASKVDMQAAEDKARSLGLVVGVENVEAFKQYRAAMNDADDVMSGFKKTIGDAVMPVLTKLAEWFADIGPTAILVVKGAIGGLITVFWALETVAVTVFELLKAGFIHIATPIIQSISAISKAISGDFSGARDDLAMIPKIWDANWETAFDNIKNNAKNAADKVFNLFANPMDSPAKKDGGKHYTPPKDGAGKDLKEKSHMPEYEAALAEKKNQYEKENVLRQYSKQQELAYWQELIATTKVAATDKVAIAKRTAMLELEIRRDLAKKQLDLDAVTVDQAQAAANDRVAIDEALAKAALDNGLTTKEQYLAQEEQFEARRYEIALTALAQRIALAEKDPTRSPAEIARLYAEVDQIDSQHQIKRIQLSSQMAQESGQIWKDLGERMSGLWDKGVQALMNGTLTWKNGMQAVGAEVVAWFARDVVGKQVTAWIAGETKKIAMKMGFLAQETGAQAAGSAATVGIKAAEGTAVVGVNATEAASGAAASQAMIPVIGPGLAIAAAGMMLAFVLGMSGKKSAANGYDIPRGINPMTQLHEEEMVLPAKHANVIRDMADGGSAGGGSLAPVHIHGSPDDTIKLKDLAKVLRQMNRNFVLVK